MPPHSAPAPPLTLSPRQLAALLDSSPGLYFLLGPDCVVLHAGAALTRVLGFSSDQIVGRPFSSLLHPEDAASLRLDFIASATHRCRLRTADGSWRWFEIAVKNLLHDSAVAAIAVHCLEISSLLRMEAERQVISDIVHALNQTANLDQLLRQIHQALKKVVYAENCFVALFDPATQLFSFPFCIDRFDPAPAPQSCARSCTSYVFHTGNAHLIPQREFDRLAAQGEVELVGSPSPAWLGVPLKTPDATIGVLVVQHYEDENAYDRRDLEFLGSVGGHIAIAIERRRFEETIRKNESMFRLLFANNPLPTWVIDCQTLRFLQVNDAAVCQYGYSAEEFLRMTALDLRPPEQREELRQFFSSASEDGRYLGQWKHVKKDGKVIDVDFVAHDLDYSGLCVRLAVAQDISERQMLEQQLRQAQKMEAVGRLAGGVAHDFNNLLMVIKGHTELLLNILPPADHVTRKIEQINRSADRAASLTRQLLAFSRMQVLQLRVMDLNSVVHEMGKLLPRLIGEDIDLAIHASPNLGAVRADPSQMEQVIMNLAVNARDAMPSGGRLLIETHNADVDFNYSMSHVVMKPGQYVMLAVSDSGTGMSAETQAHIFEPFFTTKEKGKGTGLGLATVYGVVKQSGGFIWVYSELGKGTCFKIYLPRVDQAAEKSACTPPFVEIPRGTETILLAEDEKDVREVAREFLESGGYQVIEARDGADALQRAAEHGGTLDLLVTDMVMPGMTGQELASRLQAQQQGISVIFMSGYSEQAASDPSGSTGPVKLLTKPFSRSAILRAVREVLNASRS